MGSKKFNGKKSQGGNGSKKPSSTKAKESRNKNGTSTHHVFQVHGHRNKQSMTYGKVMEHLILKIQSTFKSPNVIVKSLRDKKKGGPTEPSRTRVKIPVGAKDDEREQLRFEQETADIKFKSKWDEYTKEKSQFDEEWSKAYSLVFQTYCTSEMKSALKELPDFESRIQDDPLEILESISKLMHTPMKACYPMASLAETFSSLLNLRQLENEKLLDYYERFSQEATVAKSLLGKDFLDKFVENTIEFQALTDVDAKTTMN